MPFGRFAEGFIESRRLALTKCIQKIAAHPRLRKDPDLRLFLESDSFAMDVCCCVTRHAWELTLPQIKHRKLENERAGLMASIGSSITGPKFYETDEVIYASRLISVLILMHVNTTPAVVRQKEILSRSIRITVAKPCQGHRGSSKAALR